MGYIVPFLTISSILIDISFTNLIFIGAMFNSYNSWYLLSLPSSFTLHYSILFLIISVILYSLISCYFRCYIKFSLYVLILYLLLMNVKLRIHLSLLILSSFFSNSTFFIPIFLDFFIIFPIFFFKGPINSIEVFNSFNSCYSILFINFFSLFFQIQFIILVIIYALGLQWAWQFNIIFQPLNIGFDSYCDHYIISMINKKWIDSVVRYKSYPTILNNLNAAVKTNLN